MTADLPKNDDRDQHEQRCHKGLRDGHCNDITIPTQAEYDCADQLLLVVILTHYSIIISIASKLMCFPECSATNASSTYPTVVRVCAAQ